MVDLLRGEAPVLVHTPQTATMAWNDEGYWVLTIPSTREATEEIHLAPRPDDFAKPWDQQRMRVLDVRVVQQGYVLYHAELSDHAGAPTEGPLEVPDALPDDPKIPPSGPVCDAEIPRRIHVEVPNPQSDVRFEYQNGKLSWNPPLPDGTFVQPRQPGMSVEQVTCE
jgi:hypothetical protein